MDTNKLNLFVEVAKKGSFAAVAKQLNIDPSSVSRSIAVLEETLRLRLFRRSTRKLSLTEAGKTYLSRIEPLLAELEFANEEAQALKNVPSGKLCVTASTSFGQLCLLPHIREFQNRYKEITLELRLTDVNVDLLMEDVDLACRLTPGFNSDLVGVRLFDTHYHVCVSPEYFKSMPEIILPHDLEQHKCLVFSLPNYRSRWVFKDQHKKNYEVKIESQLATSSALALRECTIKGMGPALLADWLIDQDIKEGRLIPILTDYKVTATDFDTAVWLLYPSRQFLPHKTRLMIDFLKEKFRDRK